ncbi:PREDICTED: polyadenylate-binding protein, cytoplasmic and nuclear-like [Brassica oleracea var. oleracea]|uniref:polyadenylate-binding protein, cytoplasmic and nuclear-like n=1 Tax=Brassica oleracea var. oleracea TaxID=109376 RepID=UPI0006A71029|nr:PREDICTED: polyadenylate-binding protein, cytoplasmic and nuclear-like [Brassica oleracea var. oleracea]
MASSSKANSLGKRKPEDDLDTEPVLRRHKSEAKETKSDESALNSAKETIEGLELDEDPDFVEEAAGPPNKKLFLDKLSSQTEISDVIDFFKDVGQVVGVRLMLNHKGGRVDKRVGRRVENRLGLGFVEFASSDEAKKALKMKTGEYWSRNKVFLKVAATSLPPKYCVDHNVWYEDYLQREGLLIEGLDEIPDSAEEPAIPKKTLFVGRFSPQTKPRDIIDFFKDVGGVSYVRLIGDHTGKHVGYGFVDFASVNDANKALQQKNGESLHDCKIFLELANNGATYLPPKYCLDYKVWFEESLPVEGLDATPDFAEATAVPKKTLFISHLSHQKTIISDIIDFFKDAGEVVRVRLILDQCGEHAGCGFVEFASSNEANKALQQKNGEYLHNSSIFLDVANNEFAENLPPKHCIDHKVWFNEDLLQSESFVIEEDKTPAENVLLVANLSPQTTKISHIIKFFKNVGDVVSVRLIVNRECKHVGYGFIEFASPYEAQEALKMVNGAYMDDHKIMLMKGLDQTTPDFVEAVATSRSKTLYVANLPREKTEISHIIDFFKDVGQVVHVRLICNLMGNHVGTGFVEFASADEAKKALEKKNGEHFHRRKIFLDVPKKAQGRFKYCIDHKVWYENYLRQESLLIGADETPDFAEILIGY